MKIISMIKGPNYGEAISKEAFREAVSGIGDYDIVRNATTLPRDEQIKLLRSAHVY